MKMLWLTEWCCLGCLIELDDFFESLTNEVVTVRFILICNTYTSNDMMLISSPRPLSSSILHMAHTGLSCVGRCSQGGWRVLAADGNEDAVNNSQRFNPKFQVCVAGRDRFKEIRSKKQQPNFPSISTPRSALDDTIWL